jgi:hypothetical protein
MDATDSAGAFQSFDRLSPVLEAAEKDSVTSPRCPAGQGLILLLMAAGFVFGAYAWHGAVNLNVSDEGYLWDGVRRTREGDVPIRDFNAYDPGRYYWCAAGSWLFGSGILGLRLSAALFRVLGLWLGLLAVRRVTTNFAALGLAGLFVWAWNPTYYKTFEPSTALAAVYVGVLYIERPTVSRHFLAGLVVGLAAFLGRNLGLYTLAAYSSLMLFLSVKKVRLAPLPRCLGAWLAGIVTGYSPLLLMLAWVPDFAPRFAESVKFLFVVGSTNLPLRAPWPWTLDASAMKGLDWAAQAATGTFFLLWVLFGVVAVPIVLRTRADQVRRRALLIASALASVFFAHHASVRSDYQHLAHCIPPLLLGLIALPPALGMTWRSVGGVASACLLAGLTAAASLPYNFPVQFFRWTYPDWQYVSYATRTGDALRIPRWQVDAVAMIEGVVNRHLGPKERFLIAPYEAGFYPLLDTTSPIWNDYFVYPELASRQRRMIRELEENHVGLALINDAAAADGREDYRFRNSNPLVWQYLRERFQVVRDAGLPPGWLVLKRSPSSLTGAGFP